jgi:hypothetical protein
MRPIIWRPLLPQCSPHRRTHLYDHTHVRPMRKRVSVPMANWHSMLYFHGTPYRSFSAVERHKQRIASGIDDPARMLLASCTCLPEMNS